MKRLFLFILFTSSIILYGCGIQKNEEQKIVVNQTIPQQTYSAQELLLPISPIIEIAEIWHLDSAQVQKTIGVDTFSLEFIKKFVDAPFWEEFGWDIMNEAFGTDMRRYQVKLPAEWLSFILLSEAQHTPEAIAAIESKLPVNRKSQLLPQSNGVSITTWKNGSIELKSFLIGGGDNLSGGLDVFFQWLNDFGIQKYELPTWAIFETFLPKITQFFADHHHDNINERKELHELERWSLNSVTFDWIWADNESLLELSWIFPFGQQINKGVVSGKVKTLSLTNQYDLFIWTVSNPNVFYRIYPRNSSLLLGGFEWTRAMDILLPDGRSSFETNLKADD